MLATHEDHIARNVVLDCVAQDPRVDDLRDLYHRLSKSRMPTLLNLPVEVRLDGSQRGKKF